eukprot:GFUD01091544.1.p1 GENE.GFUD01091544.1~~GFUD01091544.1.p1  ORF type:complete len:311 (-),score=87.61 GFUD01091544.1:73-1005(-)
MECLDRVELFEGPRKVGIFGKNENSGNFTERKPFKIKMDICKQNLNRFLILYVVKNTKGKPLVLKKPISKYSPPSYFDANSLPPYCMEDTNISIALTHNMTHPAFYKHCIEKVVVCQCREKNQCGKCRTIGRSFGSDAGEIVYQEQLDKTTTILKLTYYRTDPNKAKITIDSSTYLELDKDHCNEQIVVPLKQMNHSIVYMIGGSVGVGGGLFLLIIIVVILILLCKNKEKKKMTQESVDINPDYGYNQEGVEYEESAVKDINLDYGYSVDDPNYMETVITDANVDYGYSVDEEEYQENEQNGIKKANKI